MASRQDTVDYLLDQAAHAGRLSFKKMFGEYALYCDGKMAALVCDDQLFVKPTAAGRAFLGAPREGRPFPGAKAWFLIDGDECEDADWLSDLIRITARELPLPKPKVKKATAKTRAKAKSKTVKVKRPGKAAAKRVPPRPKKAQKN